METFLGQCDDLIVDYNVDYNLANSQKHNVKAHSSLTVFIIGTISHGSRNVTRNLP